MGMIDLVGRLCPLAADPLVSSVSSAIRGRASRGILGPLAHPLYEFLRRDSMGIHTRGGVGFTVRRRYGRRAGLLPAALSDRRVLIDGFGLSGFLPAELPPGAKV